MRCLLLVHFRGDMFFPRLSSVIIPDQATFFNCSRIVLDILFSSQYFSFLLDPGKIHTQGSSIYESFEINIYLTTYTINTGIYV